MKPELEARFLTARRAVIARRFSGLNEMQRRAVMTTQGPLLLLAGAGSGKTTVLINRIANLIAFGEASDSNEIPDYVTDEDVEFLEAYLQTGDEAHEAAGRGAFGAASRRAVVDHRDHVYKQGGERTQGAARARCWGRRPSTSGR